MTMSGFGVFMLGALLVLTQGTVLTKRGTCPSGWTSTHNGCYSVIKDNHNWVDAQDSCEAMNAHLVTITSYEENVAVTSLLNGKGGERAWIGLNDMLAEGRFRWVHSNTDTTYTRWGGGEPSNWNGREHCGELFHSGYWNDQPCDYIGNFFICEID